MKIIIKAAERILNFIYFFYKKLPTKNQVAIISRQDDKPSEDIKLLQKELEKRIPVKVSCKKIDSGIVGKISYIWYILTEQMVLFATSKAVVLDGYCICASMLAHKKELRIIQMWHACGAFKKFGLTATGLPGGRDKELSKAMKMHQNYDLVFASSVRCINPVANSFGCANVCINPLPRIDLLNDPSWLLYQKGRFFEKYPENRKIILYAPTFRKNDLKRTLSYEKKLQKEIDDKKYLLITKHHPSLKTDDPYAEFSSMELLAVADYVITDYSSFIFEAAYAGIKTYRYVPDEKEYKRNLGFLIKEEEIPFYKSKDTKKLIKQIKSDIYDKEAADAFAKKFIESKENNTKEMADKICSMI